MKVSSRPTQLGIETLISNLQKKFSGYGFFLKLECWAHSSGNKSSNYSLSIVPGTYGSSCDIHGLSSWKSLLAFYHELMDREEI